VNPEEEMNTLRPLTLVILLALALGMNACSSIGHHSSEAKYSDHPLRGGMMRALTWTSA